MSAKIQLKTSNDLNSLIKEVFSESIRKFSKKRLNEEDENGDVLLLDDTEESPTDTDKDTLKKGDVTVDDIIEKLNSIRAGKSFKDSAIKSSLEKYIADLEIAEKTALFAFLKGIAQLVTGEIEPQVATEPSDPEPSVSMKKKESASGKRTVVVKPTIVKSPSKNVSQKSNKEDTTAPAPITPVQK